MPAGEGSELPDGPLGGVTLVLDSLTGPEFLRQRSQDTTPEWLVEGEDLAVTAFDFEVSLPPGTYQLALLEVDAPVLMATDLVPLPTALLEFRVPRATCAYVGEVSAHYYRLPAGRLAEQEKAFNELTRRVELDPLHEDIFVHLPSGGLVPEFESMRVELPPPDARPQGAASCEVWLAEFVLQEEEEEP
jgi:hypothetical protein